MNDDWKELAGSELLNRADVVLQACRDNNFSSGQSIRAMVIALETTFRAVGQYDLPDDDLQVKIIQETGEALLPSFEKYGVQIVSTLLFMIGNVVNSSVDLKGKGKGYE